MEKRAWLCSNSRGRSKDIAGLQTSYPVSVDNHDLAVRDRLDPYVTKNFTIEAECAEEHPDLQMTGINASSLGVRHREVQFRRTTLQALRL